MIRRIFNNQPIVKHETQRENIFHRRNKVLENTCSLTVDSGSCWNCSSIRLVEKFDLQVIPHPKSYKLQWLNGEGDLIVDKQVKVSLYIGNYKDNVLSDVVPMKAYHILFRRPRKFDKKTTHTGLTNELTFTHKDKTFVPFNTFTRDREPCTNENKKR